VTGPWRIVPSDQVRWSDLEAVLGPMRCHGMACWCQKFRILTRDWKAVSDAGKAARLKAQTCDAPRGVVAFDGTEPVGWASVGPRAEFANLITRPTVWKGREVDREEVGVWAIPCLVVRPGWRRRGMTAALVAAGRDLAFAQGAKAVEGYPMRTEPGHDIPWGELHVGPVSAFARAEFRIVARPSKRRLTMRSEPT
jgi:GNAT superfamily N-acetyltransferase